MKHIITVYDGIKIQCDCKCGDCQASCQTACKTSNTVANQECELRKDLQNDT